MFQVIPRANDQPLGLGWVARLASGLLVVCFLFTLHAVPILGSSSVTAWGYNSYGQTNVPTGLTNAVMVAGGGHHSLALKDDGTVTAWGHPSVSVVPSNLNHVVAIAAGAHNLALKRDGTVWEWQSGMPNVNSAPAGLFDVVAIATGNGHSLALRDDGTVVAWGFNPHGEATVPADLMDVVAIGAGDGFSVALKHDGTLVGWGLDYSRTTTWRGWTNVTDIMAQRFLNLARLSDGSWIEWDQARPRPFGPIRGKTNVVAIAVGNAHFLGLKAEGDLLAWGSDFQGRATVLPGLTNPLAIACGGEHNLVVTGTMPPFLTRPLLDRTAYWGEPLTWRMTALGTGPLQYRWLHDGAEIPGATLAVLSLAEVAPADAGNYTVVVSNALGVATSETAVLAVLESPPVVWVQPASQRVHWGAEVVFQVGAGGSWPLEFQWQFNEVDLVGATNASLVLPQVLGHHAGQYALRVRNHLGEVLSSNATLSVDRLVAWGNNEDWDDCFSGQAIVPEEWAGLTSIRGLAAGAYHSVVVDVDGTIRVWGDPAHGQQDGVPEGDVVSVAAGEYSNIAVMSDGRVQAWGNGWPPYNYFLRSHVVATAVGEQHALGLTAEGRVLVEGDYYYGPCRVPEGLAEVVAIATGDCHSLALTGEGRVVAWGVYAGARTNVPPDLTQVVAIAAADTHSLALKADGTVIAWGENQDEQVEVPPGLSNVVAIGAGFGGSWGGCSVALKSDGTVVAWGTGPALAVPHGLTNVAAIAVGGAHVLAFANDGSPAITVQPHNRTAEPGETAFFAVMAAGAQPLSYQWQRDGVDIPGATNSVLAFPSAEWFQAGSYRVQVSNEFGSTLSEPAVLVVRDFGEALEVPGLAWRTGGESPWTVQTEQTHDGEDAAQNGIVEDGEESWLETTVTVDTPTEVSFWWRVYSSPGDFGLAFYTNSFLAGPNIDGYWGWHRRSVVLPPGTHTLRWTCHNVGVGGEFPYGQVDEVSFTSPPTPGVSLEEALDATGLIWVRGGSGEEPGYIPWSGQTNVTHDGVDAAQGSGFGCGPWSYVETLVEGPGMVSFWWKTFTTEEWFEDGDTRFVVLDTTGAAESYLALPGNADWRSDTVYFGSGPKTLRWISHGYCNGHDETTYAWLDQVIVACPGREMAPQFMVLSSDQTHPAGTNVTLQAVSIGYPVPAQQWFFEGVALPFETNATLSLENIQAFWSGTYTAVASNAHGSISHSLILTVQDRAPVILAQPQSQTLAPGMSTILTVSGQGTWPIGYQWRFKGVDLPGETSAQLSLSTVATSQTGAYSVVLSNAIGAVASDDAAVTVVPVVCWGGYGQQNNVPAAATDVVNISAGGWHSLALHRNGTVTGWEWHADIQPDWTNLVAVEAGGFQSIVLRADGTVAVSGFCGDLQCDIPAGLANVVAIASGSRHNLVLTGDGSVVAWGRNYWGHVPVPAWVTNVVAIAAGEKHSLALRGNGTVLGWGNNESGQTNVPASLGDVVAISAGGLHSLALKANGTVVAWGANTYHQADVPPGLSGVVAISAGATHSLALKADGTVAAWGDNRWGQLNVPTGLPAFQTVSAGGVHSLALIGQGPPRVTRSPLSRAEQLHSKTYFVAEATGAPPLSYQWCRDGVRIPGATAAVLALVDLSETDAGVYSVMVSNVLGRATSAPALLSFGPRPPLLLSQPASQTVPPNATVRLHVTAASSTALSYQWWQNGTNRVFGAHKPVLDLPNVQALQEGDYAVVVSNVAGAVTSQVARVAIGLSDTDRDGLPDAWEHAYGFNPMNWWDARLDADGDRASNEEEFWAGTDPHDTGSVLAVEVSKEPPIASIRFIAQAGFSYEVQLKDAMEGSAWRPLTWVEMAWSPPTRLVTVVDEAANMHRRYRVLPLPALQMAAPSDGGGQVRFIALAGQLYLVERCTRLGPGADWQPLRYVLASSTDWVTVNDSNPGPARFYRLQRVGEPEAFLPTLEEALDVPGLEWRTSEWVPWFGQNTLCWVDGVDAAQAGALNPDGGSFLETIVEGPGMISFWWRREVIGECLNPGGGVTFSATSGDSAWDTYLSMPDFPDYCYYPDGTFWDWRLEYAVLGPGPNVLHWYCSGTSGEGWPLTYVWLDALEVAGPGREMAPKFLPGAESRTILAGTDTTLTAQAMAYPLPAWQWFHNGVPIPDATNATLTLRSVQASQAGDYTARISNPAGTATSEPVRLSVAPAPAAWGCAGSLDTSFNVGSGVDVPGYAPTSEWLDALAVQPDGRVLVGGNFTVLQGLALHGLARLNADGTVDTGFVVPWADNGGGLHVQAIAPQADGKILFGGDLSELGAIVRNGLARLNVDGSLDPSFLASGEISFDRVTALALTPGGRILAGGSWGGQHFVVRRFADGRQDTSFGSLHSFDQPVFSLIALPEGKVLVNGTTRLNEDGTVDAGFAPPAFGDWIVRAAGLQADGKVLLGASRTAQDYTEKGTVIRLNTNGSRDESFAVSEFAVPYPSGYAHAISGLAVQGDGRILVCGQFLSVNGVRRTLVARLLADGSLDARFEPDIVFNEWHDDREFVSEMVLTAEGKMLIGGLVRTINGQPRSSLARLHTADGGCTGIISLAADSFFVNETNRHLSISVTRRGEFSQALSVHYSAEAGWPGLGQATAGADFLAQSGEVRFEPGETNRTVLVELQDDALVEANEEFTMQLIEVDQGAVLAYPAQARILILDDESAGMPGSVDERFAPQLDGAVRALAVQPDGRVIMAGAFSHVNGAACPGVARLYPDGSLDHGFCARTDGTIHALLVVPGTGQILIGGRFDAVNGQARANLARLNANGSLDLAFNADTGNTVSHLALCPNGQIMVGGEFTQVNNVARNNVARLNTDGTLDTAFDLGPGLQWGSGGPLQDVLALAVQPDGKALVGGMFNLVNGVPQSKLARLNPDGTVDTSFAAHAVFSTVYSFGWVWSIGVQPDGKVLAGGWFSSSGSSPRLTLICLNSDGTLSTNFHSSDRNARQIVLQPDGKFITSALERHLPNGELDPSFFAGSGTLDYDNVQALSLAPSGDLLVGGTFTRINGLSQAYLARLRNAMPPPRIFGPPISRTKCVGQTVTFDVYAHGTDLLAYQWYGLGMPIPGATNRSLSLTNLQLADTGTYSVAVRHPSGGSTNVSATLTVVPVPTGPGALDSGFDPGSGVDPTYDYAVVASLALQPDGKILIGGDFGLVDGQVRNLLARLNPDGSVDATFDPGSAVASGADYTVWAIALQPDGRILVGGDIGGPAPIKRLLPDGSLDEDFNYTAYPSVAYVHAIAVQPDHKIIVGGTCGLTRLEPDGTVDPTFQQIPCDPGWVHALALQPDGKILIGGDFIQVSGVPRTRIARLNADGSLDASFQPGLGANGRVTSLVLQSDGKVLLGGEFTAVNGVPRPGVARLNADGSLDQDFNPGSDFRWVRAVALQPDDKILIGHEGGVARLLPDGRPDPAFGDGPVIDSEVGGYDVYEPGVHALLVQPDGAVVLGGGFVRVNGALRRCVARITGDSEGEPSPGALDARFSSRLVGDVSCLVEQPDGRLMVGGGFWVSNSTMQLNLARLLPDGTVDPSFVPSSGVPWRVAALAVQPDGRVLAGYAGGYRASEYLVPGPQRFHPDGRPDDTFHFGLFNDPRLIGYWTKALAALPDGKVLVGGRLAYAGAEEDYWLSPALNRLLPDGSVDPTFTSYSGGIEALALLPTGHILVAGGGLIRLLPDGRIDTAWTAGPITPPSVHCLVLQPDGRILIGGGFTNVQGQARCRIARLHADGQLDLSFDPPPIGGDEEVLVKALARQADGRVLVGGNFRAIGGQLQECLARLNPDGSLDTQFRTGQGLLDDEQSRVEIILVQDHNMALVGGTALGSYGGTEVNGLFRVHLGEVGAPPTIAQQPASLTRSIGQRAVLSVVAVGTPPLAFQWLANGAVLPDATNATLILDNVQSAQAGLYAVIVANELGSVTSAEAMLTVLPAPSGPGSLDLTFDPTVGMTLPGILQGYSVVRDIVVQPDGRLLVGGEFAAINGVPRNRVARLQPDGSLDLSFNSGFGPDGEVVHVALQPDGKVLLAGLFSSVDGSARQHLARLNADGSLDRSFACELAGSMYVSDLALRPDGKIWIGGYPLNPEGTAPTSLARLNPDGSLDAEFDPTGLPFDRPYGVVAMALQPDGKLLVSGGSLTSDRTLYRLHADGTLDASFTDPQLRWYSEPEFAYDVALQSDGRIIVVGDFATVGGAPCSNVARLHADGTRDDSFDTSGLALDHYPVTAVAQPDGRVIISGYFTHVSGQPRETIARLQQNGHLDPSFDASPTFSNSVVFAVALLADGGIAAGGYGFNFHPVAVLDPDGRVETDFNAVIAGPAKELNALALTAQGRVLILGQFTSINGEPRTQLAWLNQDGTLDTSFALPTNFRLWTRAAAVQPDGKVVLVGYDQAAEPLLEDDDGNIIWYRYQPVVRLNADGSVDPSFDPPTSFEGDYPQAEAIALQSDGKILVGGTFRLVDGLPYSLLARLHPDGSLDTTFAMIPLSMSCVDEGCGVARIVLQPDGKILITGGFVDETGAHTGLARLHPNGGWDESFQARLEPAWSVTALALGPEGKIVIAGWFSQVNGVARPGLARLHPDGSLDLLFNPVLDSPIYIQALTTQADGKVLVGSDYDLIRLNPDGSLDESFQVECVEMWGIRSLMIQPDGQVLISGAFSSVNGWPMGGIARLNNDWVGAFVQRELPHCSAPGSTVPVRLLTTPPGNSSVYAVEDQPPAGWLIANVTHGGVFDARTGKVKFGPFYDAAPRVLSYELVPPPDVQGRFCFSGRASSDGLDSAIAGAPCLMLPGPHPADLASTDWQMGIGEVTAYGAAWRRGEHWPVPPMPIPIDYVTRAAALWRGGECYAVDCAIPAAPLWWVNCAQPSHAAYTSATLQSRRAGLQDASAVTRQAPSVYVPGEAIDVILSTAPAASTLAYAVEEQVPAGWAVSNIGQGGNYDPVNRRVKWGPFLDNTARTLTYQVVPPTNASGALELAGVASFDGTSANVGGVRQVRESCRLLALSSPSQGAFRWALSGRLGARFLIEASSDLQTWTPLATVTNKEGNAEFHDPDWTNFRQRFYRASVIP